MMKTFKEKALAYHEFPRAGKIAVQSARACDTAEELALAYGGGAGEAVMAVYEDPENAYRYTGKGNLVAVVTNGSSVLGYGNVGPLAGKPIMEAKAMLYSKFAGISAIDIEVEAASAEEFIRTVASISPGFGAIHLEDIKAPECFAIEAALRQRLNIPVLHDDQHGSAVAACAGLINALSIQGKAIDQARIAFAGAGAAGAATARLLKKLGARHILMTDIDGVLYQGRADSQGPVADLFVETPHRALAQAIVGADVFIGLSVGGVLTPAMLETMAARPIVFALALPQPEILPDVAKATRPDVLVATGSPAYPNQVNNSLSFPYVFRGALDARATTITEGMLLAAVHAIAALAREPVPQEVLDTYQLKELGFGPDYILPKQFDKRLLERVPLKVKQAWQAQQLARQPAEALALAS